MCILNKDFSFKKKQGDDSLSTTCIKSCTCGVTDDRFFRELDRHCLFMAISMKITSESELGSILQFATVYQELHQVILSSLWVL